MVAGIRTKVSINNKYMPLTLEEKATIAQKFTDWSMRTFNNDFPQNSKLSFLEICAILDYWLVILKDQEGLWVQKYKPTEKEREEIYNEVKSVPMGVSQWLNHGKQYGYDKYFNMEDPLRIAEEHILMLTESSTVEDALKVSKLWINEGKTKMQAFSAGKVVALSMFINQVREKEYVKTV